MKTWAECHAAGMTMAQAVKATGKTERGAQSWATRHLKKWPVAAISVRSDRQAMPAISSTYSTAKSTAPATNVSAAPWGEIEIDARADTAPRNRVIRSRPLPAGGPTQAEITIAAIREVHREHMNGL